MMYKELAKYYDLIYSWKDYKGETKRIKKLIKDYKNFDLATYTAEENKCMLHVYCHYTYASTSLFSPIPSLLSNE